MFIIDINVIDLAGVSEGVPAKLFHEKNNSSESEISQKNGFVTDKTSMCENTHIFTYLWQMHQRG
ncbi:hypothetical protein McpCs1_04320 [Methanocorpusculaceae archaeon Cs1]|uniref:Uncharacterized protein n=1 Tax=Methanorbis rubei TaxID=3028300 RepID=A0AAE4MDT2_9EURY|nr:hypothetical protein [Methanocorpusculaceae archaeon Cs1]